MIRRREPNGVGVLLRIPIFRRMWAAIAISSLGDWLGLLATTSLAAYFTRDSSNLAQGAAVSGVLLTRLLPDLLLGPVAGALVDKLDRRAVAAIGDTAAGLLYLSILIGDNLIWLLIAQFLVEAVGLFSSPAKQALWVNIVPRERLAVANQLNYVSIYGMVPVAALLFALLSTIAQFFGATTVDPSDGTALISGATSTAAIDIALAFDAITYFVSAATVFFSRALIPAFVGERASSSNIFSLIREGISFVKNSRIMRAIYVGILGAFGAGGLVAGVAQAYVATLGAGNAGYGILFGSVFTGLALGMLIGPKVFPTVPRRMIFTFAIGASGLSLVAMGLLQDFVGAVVMAAVMGLFAGVAWITGFTMIGHEVSDQLRGRVFAFVMSSVRLTLLGTIAVGPILAGAVGSHLLEIGQFQFLLSGPAIVLAVGGLVALLVSVYAGRQIGGLAGQLVRRVLGRRRATLIVDESDHPGVLIAIEGNQSAEVDRYAAAVLRYLRAAGWQAIDQSLDEVAGHAAAAVLDSPAAALRSIADLADLAADRLRPELDAGSVVVCRGFRDAVVVRFGSEGGLEEGRILRIAAWATEGLRADLTLLVDGLLEVPAADPQDALTPSPAAEATGSTPAGPAAAADQPGSGDLPPQAGLSSEPADGPVVETIDPAQAFRDLAASAPERYLVVRPVVGEDPVPVEVVGRIASVLRMRSPALAAPVSADS